MATKKRRFFNTYLTATVSVSLVLLLVGLECVVALSTGRFMTDVKESTTLTMVLSEETTEEDTARVSRLLNAAPFCKQYHYVSKEEALADHIESFGEDPTEFLGYNPIRAAYEVTIVADYVQQDSLAAAEAMLKKYTFVEEIVYPHTIVDFFSENVNNMLSGFLIVACILLLISVVLIVNTIRLTVYSRRFLINTMKLVGAKPWMIKGPIVRRSVFMGFLASLLALALVACVVYYVYVSFGFWLFPLQWQNIAFIAVTMIVVGLLLTFFASLFAVNKYIRLRSNDLYLV